MDNQILQNVAATTEALATNVAWGATLLCTVATIYCADTWAKSVPRIFAALALFAMSWAVLLPYYWPSGGDELLSAYQGILLVLAGGPLRREGADRKHAQRKVSSFDRWGLSLLLALLVPHVVRFPVNPDWLLNYLPIINVWLGTALVLIGFYSVGDGVKAVMKSKKWIWLAAAFALYGLLEVSYAIHYSGRYVQLEAPSEFAKLPMLPPFKWAFAVAKCVVTSLFLWLSLRAVKSKAKHGVAKDTSRSLT
jgi:hypothetical protein